MDQKYTTNITQMNARLERARIVRQMQALPIPTANRPHQLGIPQPLRRSNAMPLIYTQPNPSDLERVQISRYIISKIVNNDLNSEQFYLDKSTENKMIDHLRTEKMYMIPVMQYDQTVMYAYRYGQSIYLCRINSKCNVVSVTPYISPHNKNEVDYVVTDDGSLVSVTNKPMEFYYREEVPQIVDAIGNFLIPDLIGVVLECINYEDNVDFDTILAENHINRFNNPFNA
jgi:hypothetical protein